MISKFIANMMTKPGLAPVFGSPEDFGMNYEDVEFKASDGVKISGWFTKGSKDKVIIQTHFGIQSCRSGWTPEGKSFPKVWKENIEFLRAAKKFNEAGYSVLVYDLRNHGNSGKGTCPWVSGGTEEYKDVIAAVEFINKRFNGPKIGLMSLCMGAASSAYAFAAKGGLTKHKNIKAMVALQPSSYISFLEALKIPKFIIKRASKISMKRGGPDFYFEPLDKVSKITVPTLVVQNKNDPMVKMDWVKDFYNRLNVEKEMLWLDLEKNRFAGYDYYTKNPKKMIEWFDKYI